MGERTKKGTRERERRGKKERDKWGEGKRPHDRSKVGKKVGKVDNKRGKEKMNHKKKAEQKIRK
jgi:hypothetical protein